MPKHPRKTRLEGLTKNRLKRNSFVHESQKLNRQCHDRLPESTLPFFPPDMSEPWVTNITDIKVHTTVPSLSGGDTRNGTVNQSLPLAMNTERYPQEVWIHVFTGILPNLPLWSKRPNRRARSTNLQEKTWACQHFPDDQTLRLQTGIGDDDFIHLLSGPDPVT